MGTFVTKLVEDTASSMIEFTIDRNDRDDNEWKARTKKGRRTEIFRKEFDDIRCGME